MWCRTRCAADNRRWNLPLRGAAIEACTIYTPGMADAPMNLTLRDLGRMAKSGAKFSCLTCYDATTARWLEKSGLEVLLVGDTAAEMILGYASTINAPLDFMVTITAAVKRGAPSRIVMADMPFMSYQADDAEAIRNAGRFMTEGNADCVKLEMRCASCMMLQPLRQRAHPCCSWRRARQKLRSWWWNARRFR